MAVQHSIWQVGDKPVKLAGSSLVSEKLLEDMIAADSSILSDDWMLVGRQVFAASAGYIDLLAVAPDGSLVIIELKRNMTPREVVAQGLDYASWVSALEADDIVEIYNQYAPGRSLAEDFRARFGNALDDDALNNSHQVVIVASKLDASSERIVNYLNRLDVPINVVFFSVFEHGDAQLLSRVWMLDPTETQINATGTGTPTEKEPWNGEFYVSFGDSDWRSWDDARRYGFVSAGGGEWYSKTLNLLKPNDRVWVKIPGQGFVGVGRVTGPAIPANQFEVTQSDGSTVVLTELPAGDSAYGRKMLDNPEKWEYVVPIRWLETVDREHAFTEVGLFGNQNTVCKPTASKWRTTVEQLKQRFPNYTAE